MPPIRIDPRAFAPGAVDRKTAKFNDELETTLKDLPKIYEIGAPAVREFRKQGLGVLADQPYSKLASWRKARANGLSVPVRVFRAKKRPRAVYLHIHGGGWCIGGADAQDQFMEAFVRDYGIAVVSVEYRLAPEHPFPAGPDDCEAAAVWLMRNAKKEFGTDILLIGGESAGAHLSALTLLRMRDRHRFTGFAGANLLYGAYDLSMGPAVRNWGERNLILSTPVTQWFGDQFLPPETYSREARRDPEISPLYARLHDMPPALFTCGTTDPLIDESMFMASRWLAAGNESRLDLYPGGIHAFNAFPIPIADKANAAMMKFLSDCVDNVGGRKR